jgi:hypothetical protein
MNRPLAYRAALLALALLPSILSAQSVTLTNVEPTESLLPGDYVQFAATATVTGLASGATASVRLRVVVKTPAGSTQSSGTAVAASNAVPVVMTHPGINIPLQAHNGPGLAMSCDALNDCSIEVSLYADIVGTSISSPPRAAPVTPLAEASLSVPSAPLQSEIPGVTLKLAGLTPSTSIPPELRKVILSNEGFGGFAPSAPCPPNDPARRQNYSLNGLFLGFCGSAGITGPATLLTYAPATAAGSYYLIVTGKPAAPPKVYPRGSISRSQTDIVVPNALKLTDAPQTDAFPKLRLVHNDRELTTGQLNYVPPLYVRYGMFVYADFTLARYMNAQLFAWLRNKGSRDVLVNFQGTRAIRGAQIWNTRGGVNTVELFLPAILGAEVADPPDIEVVVALVPAGLDIGTFTEDKAFLLSPVTTVSFKPPPEVSGIHMEAVQVVQEADNSVPLVPRKGTVVRVFPQVTQGNQYVEGVTGTMRAFRNGVEDFTYSPLRPFNAPIVAKVTPPDRNSEFDSLDFLLPSEWTLAGYDWVYAVTIQGLSTTPKEYRNAKPFRFENPPGWPSPFGVAFIPFCYQPPGQEKKTCPSDAVRFRIDFLDALYPIPDDGLAYYPLPVPPFTWDLPFRTGDDVAAFLNSFARYYHLIDPDSIWVFGGRMDQLAAWFPRLPRSIDSKRPIPVGKSNPTWGGGQGHVVFLQDTTATDYLDASHSLAHEIGHNLSLRHPLAWVQADDTIVETPDSCGAVDPSPFNHGPDGWKYPTGRIQEPGYDPMMKRIVTRDKYDLMTYCSDPGYNIWISPYSYRRLWNAFVDPWGPLPLGAAAAVKSNGARKAGTTDTLIISGAVLKDDAGGTLQPALRVSSTQGLTKSDSSGSHCVRLMGNSGKLAETCFTPSFVDADSDPLTRSPFTVRTAYAAGTARIVLARGDTELASIKSGAAPPTVKITSPAPGARIEAGPLTIQWTGSDPDGDALTYSVLYSADGGNSFLPLAPTLTAQQFDFDATRIDGGAQVYFRVLASDGINGASDMVGPIQVMQAPKMEASTASLSFDNVLLGRANDAVFTLRNAGSGPLHVSRIGSDSPVFSVAVPRYAPIVPAGSEIQITLRFRPDSAGAKTGVLTVSTGDAGVPELKIQLAGTGVDKLQPEIKLSPVALAFGDVVVGQSADLVLNVHNSGPGPLNVKSLTIDNTRFTTPGTTAPFTVAAYADRKVTVRFGPVATGAQSGTLTVASDDPNRPSVAVALSGNGSSAPAAAPAVAVSPASLDFGGVTAGQTKDLVLTVSNTGRAALSVSAAASSNALFRVTSPAVPFSVAAGAQQAVTVRFSPSAAGSQTGTLTLSTNDPARASVAIPLSGTGTSATAASPSVSVSPASLDFGNVTAGQTRDLTLTVSNTGQASLTVSAASSSNSLFTVASPAVPFLVAAGSQQAVTVRFTPTAAGSQSGTLTLSTNDPARATVAVSLAGTGTAAGGTPAPRIAVSPASLAFGNVTVGQTASLTLTVSNGGNAALSVTAMGSSSARFAVTSPAAPVTVAAGASQPVVVAFSPLDAGPASANLEIASNDPDRRTLVVALSGAGVAVASGGARIDVSPASLDFGAVLPGRTADRTVTVSNRGGGSLTVSAIATNNLRYSIVSPSLPFSVAAGSQQTVTVRFAPPVPGSQTGSLTISSNDPARPEVSVGLAGSGYLLITVLSDSFNRPDADYCLTGPADMEYGGSGSAYYVPVFGNFSGTRYVPIGPELSGNALLNSTRDYSGIEFSGASDPCNSSAATFNQQDVGVQVDLLVPGDASGNTTQAGPFFRARAVGAGESILGASASGYWVQLHSTGEITLKRLNPEAVVATSGKPARFDNTVYHTLEISAAGNVLHVALDGKLMMFNQGGSRTTSLTLSAEGPSGGAAGIAFGAEANRGQIGGQKADNLVVSNGRPLANLPVQSNLP